MEILLDYIAICTTCECIFHSHNPEDITDTTVRYNDESYRYCGECDNAHAITKKGECYESGHTLKHFRAYPPEGMINCGHDPCTKFVDMPMFSDRNMVFCDYHAYGDGSAETD